jgi:hypothetical protein
MIQHSEITRRRFSGWLARGLLVLCATMGVALAAAALPAAALAGGSPTIESLSASQITQSDATLEAQINPGGLETTYELWMEDPCGPAMECVRVPQLLTGSMAAGTTGESLSINVQSSGEHLNIEPETAYEYWVIAKNSAGTVESRRVFRTLAETTASPSIVNESVSNVTENDATLEAQITPYGLYTGYEWQLYTIDNGEYNFIQNCPFNLPGYEECDELVRTPPAGLIESPLQYIPAEAGEQSVSLELASIGVTLDPGSTYHFRIIAADTDDEIVAGPVRTLTTLSQSTSRTEPLSSSTGALPSAFPAITIANASWPPSIDKPTEKILTNAQKLVRALKLCEKKPNKQRKSCKKQADKKYAARYKKSQKRKA